MDFQFIRDLLPLLIPIAVILWIFQMFRGRNKRVAWRDLAREIGADFVKGGFWGGSDKVVAKMKHWTITLYTYEQHNGGPEYGGGSRIFTCLRAPYVGKGGFQFSISHKGFFSSVGKLLGAQDIEVSYPDFDRKYIIKSNDERYSPRLVCQSENSQLNSDVAANRSQQ